MRRKSAEPKPPRSRRRVAARRRPTVARAKRRRQSAPVAAGLSQEPDEILPPSPEIGRPSAWETRIRPRLEKVRKMAASGATDAAIMRALGVSRTAYYRSLREREQFADILATAREPATEEVQSALFKLAVGYDSEVVREEYEVGKPPRTITTRQRAPPALAAVKFWLTNRRPEMWRDRGLLGAGPGAFDAVPYSDNVPDPQPLPPHLLPPARNNA